MPVIGVPAFSSEIVLFNVANFGGLPTSGNKWNKIIEWSHTGPHYTTMGMGLATPPFIFDQNDNADISVLADAIVGAKLGSPVGDPYIVSARDRIIAGYPFLNYFLDPTPSPTGPVPHPPETLALGRNAVSIVCAWNIIKQAQPAAISDEQERQFRQWILKIWESPKLHDNRTFQEACFERANNWGAMCRASGTAICVYLNRVKETLRLAESFNAWSGDVTSSEYPNLQFEEDTYQLQTYNPPEPNYGIIPPLKYYDYPGTTQPADGAMPEELRRDTCYNADATCAPTFHYPVPETGYHYEALQGAVVQAAILEANGISAWVMNSSAIGRAYTFINTHARKCKASGVFCMGGTGTVDLGIEDPADTIGQPPTSDDRMYGKILDFIYGVDYYLSPSTDKGKNMIGLDWYLGAP